MRLLGLLGRDPGGDDPVHPPWSSWARAARRAGTRATSDPNRCPREGFIFGKRTSTAFSPLALSGSRGGWYLVLGGVAFPAHPIDGLHDEPVEPLIRPPPESKWILDHLGIQRVRTAEERGIRTLPARHYRPPFTASARRRSDTGEASTPRWSVSRPAARLHTLEGGVPWTALEGLRELARISIAHPSRDLLTGRVSGGEEAVRVGHSNSPQVWAEAEFSRIGEDPLELLGETATRCATSSILIGRENSVERISTAASKAVLARLPRRLPLGRRLQGSRRHHHRSAEPALLVE